MRCNKSKNALQRVQDVGRRGEHCRGACRQPDIDREGEVMGGAELKAIMDKEEQSPAGTEYEKSDASEIVRIAWLWNRYIKPRVFQSHCRRQRKCLPLLSVYDKDLPRKGLDGAEVGQEIFPIPVGG